MSQYASYINSAALAILIALAVDPLIVRLRRRGVPRLVVLIGVLVVVFAAMASLALFFVYAGAQFAKELPAYQEEAQALAAQVQEWLQGLGFSSVGSEAVAGEGSLAAVLDWIAGLVAAVAEALGNLTTTALLITFLLVDVVLWPGRLAETGRRGHGYAIRLTGFTADLRQYIVVMATVSVSIGALNTVMFYLFGVPFAGLWGVLSGILNLIPFIGFLLGLIAPAILTLLEYGPQRMVVLAVAYLAINGFVQNVVQPRLVATRLSLTPLMSLLSTTFWPLVLGPAGAVIGVPLTMAARSLWLDADPATRWLADLTATKLPEGQSPPEDGADGAREVPDRS
jgi:predicted PurR-regulated permease PerM